jgi:hypothetical protein
VSEQTLESRPEGVRAAAAHRAPPPALLRAITMARATAWHETDEVHKEICRFVAELRTSGLGAVQTLLTVKAGLRDIPPSVFSRAVTWCIEAYYEPSDPA